MTAAMSKQEAHEMGCADEYPMVLVALNAGHCVHDVRPFVPGLKKDLAQGKHASPVLAWLR